MKKETLKIKEENGQTDLHRKSIKLDININNIQKTLLRDEFGYYGVEVFEPWSLRDEA